MTSQNINREELQDVRTQLEQALHNHQVWHNDVIRTIACHLQANNQDIVEGANKNCKFAQWYYSHKAHKLHNAAGYQAIGEAHQHMHNLAAKIFESASTQKQEQF